MGSLVPHLVPFFPALGRTPYTPFIRAMREVCFDLVGHDHHESEAEIEDDEPDQPPHPHAFWWDYFLAIPRAHHH